MATKRVLEEAISKLKYNSNLLRDKRKFCSNNKEVKAIDEQLSRNESMILDYEFRLAHETE